MNPIVRHILIYSSGLVSGVLLTVFIIKMLGDEEKVVEQPIAKEDPQEVVLRDTVEKVAYKKPKKIEKEPSTQAEDTLSNLPLDSLVYIADSTKELNINRELLVAVKTFTIKQLSVDTLGGNELIDSLEMSMGIQTDKNSKTIRVEFWKSPLNFEGYILGKNVVRLYGVSELERLEFYQMDKKLYLRKAASYYTLIRSEEYHKFELSKENIDDKLLQISGNG